MGRLYDAYIEVGPRFTGMGDVKKQGDQAGKEYGKAVAEAAVKAAKANVGKLGEALGKARLAEADAAGKVRIAEQKLAEVRASGKAKTSQTAAAEEALASAQRKSAAATDASASAANALGKARDKVDKATAELAKHTEAAAKTAGNRFTRAFNGSIGKLGSGFKGALSKLGGEKEGQNLATRFGVGFNGAFGGIMSRSAGLFVGAFAAIQGLRIFGSFISDAAESAKISRITANAIRATGGAAKVTAGQVGDLATAISNKTGIDDEEVQSAANMLLTFKNLRNEAGKGNDIFSRSTQAVADLSVQFGGMDGAAKQVGKALNDPVKGISALAKAGVTFTEQQKDQIKTLVKSGDVLGAQKVILKEIEGQVGGAAAAAADPMTKLKVIAGNLAEEVGGFLLPQANKFATFTTGTLIPGIRGLFSAFQGEGVTSDGFVGFMERIGVESRRVFEFFKTEALPRLRDFAGFITGTVIPAVAGFVTKVATNLAPTVRDAFGFFKTDVLPRLREFGDFLTNKVLPPVGEFANKVLASKDFLVPFLVVIGSVVGALKLWAIAQGILNIVMAANPFGLVVLAIAAVVGGLVYAYKNSEKFREVLQGAFNGIQKAAQFFAPLVKAAIDIVIGVFSLWWNYYAKPILGELWKLLQFVGGVAVAWGKTMVSAFNSIKGPAFAAIRFVINTFLTLVGTIINGAAKAFGWVPGLGPKLKTAAAEFDKFKGNVNRALAGINDQTVKITPIVLAAQQNRRTKVQNQLDRTGAGFKSGGPVFGAGTGTSDSIDAKLSNGEHVWTAKEVSKAGGHGAVTQLRKTVMSFAKGGPVGLDVKGDFPYFGKSISSIASTAIAVARPIAQALGNALLKINPTLQGVLKFVSSQVGKPYSWGGAGPAGYDCSGLISAAINVARGKNPYSRIGATGSMPWPMFAPGRGAFEVGWFKGNPGHTAATVNGVNIESAGGVGVRMGKSARGARSPLFTNQAHVKGFASGGPVLFDRGGYLPTGTSMIENRTGKPEPLARTDLPMELSDRSIEKLADAIAARPNMIDGRRVDAALSRSAQGRGI